MSTEIERKFLLPAQPGWLSEHPADEIEQGYLAIDGETEVRVRRRGRVHRLTVKHGSGLVRDEVEIAIDAADFAALWPLTGGRRVSKTRYRVAAGSATAEVDVYGGALAGLVTGEVEFESDAASREFEPPGWLGTEITGDGRYANENLARFGAPDRTP